MALKAFMPIIKNAEYIKDPANPTQAGSFKLVVPCLLTQDHGGGVDAVVFSEAIEFDILFPLDTSPQQVYAIAYQQLLDYCASKGYDTPAKTDVYTWTALDFSYLIPEPLPVAMLTASHNHADPTLGFLKELKKELKRQHDVYAEKQASTVNNTVFLGPKPLMFDYFDE